MKTRMGKWTNGAGLVLLTACEMFIFNGCAVYPSEPAYSAGVYYDYDYYPDWDVYYYPEGHVYYWNDAGRWRSGGRLPERYELHEEHGEHLRLHTRQPWTEHHEEHGGYGEQHDASHGPAHDQR